MIIVKGGTIFQEDKTFAKKDIYIEDGRIVKIAEPQGGMARDAMTVEMKDKMTKEMTDEVCSCESAEKAIDATDLYVLPGLIDIHSHGAVGHDFSDGDLAGLEEILAYQYAHGVTSYCPTSMTLSKERLLEIFRRFGSWMQDVESGFENVNREADTHKSRGQALNKMSRVVGLNMEGPFLDPAKKGAHKEEFIISPDVDFFRECNEACGNLIKLVTVAPNGEGAVEFIREIKKEGKVTIALGHTDADYDTARAALEAGASHVTHLFNAMKPFHHREPGLIGAAAEDANCMAELICDGIHVHESMVRAAFRLFLGRVVLISDSMRATGLADGVYDLGGQQVTVCGKVATLADGTIAGSVTNLFDCMGKIMEFGIPAEEAIAAATMNPAKSIGIYDEVGSLTAGKRADMLLVDKDFRLVEVLGHRELV